MGNSASSPSTSPIISSASAEQVTGEKEKPKCKACCACPETKKARDTW